MTEYGPFLPMTPAPNFLEKSDKARPVIDLAELVYIILASLHGTPYFTFKIAFHISLSVKIPAIFGNLLPQLDWLGPFRGLKLTNPPISLILAQVPTEIRLEQVEASSIMITLSIPSLFTIKVGNIMR